jgi:hypothetical protein
MTAIDADFESEADHASVVATEAHRAWHRIDGRESAKNAISRCVFVRRTRQNPERVRKKSVDIGIATTIAVMKTGFESHAIEIFIDR